MLKAAVFSDTHTHTALMVEAVRDCKPDVLIHLGDHANDTAILRREFPSLPLYSVCGNCDSRDSAPETLVANLGPVKVFLTHGHAYSVRYTLDSLVYAAEEVGAKLALYGHTHVADLQEIGGVQVLNPGTAGMGVHKSYATITVFDNGGFACEIHDLPK